MAQAQKNPARERRLRPQVLVIERSWEQESRLRETYCQALAGTDVVLVPFLERARMYTDSVIIDFVALNISTEMTDKKARRLISSVSLACPGAKIILMAREGFDAHDARVAAVVPIRPLDGLVSEIRKLIHSIIWPSQATE